MVRSVLSVLVLGLASNAAIAEPVSPLIEKARAAIRKNLKDPASARFEELKLKRVGNETAVCGWVNAKNAMGGYSGRKLFVFIAATAKAYLLEMTDDFSETEAAVENIKRFCAD